MDIKTVNKLNAYVSYIELLNKVRMGIPEKDSSLKDLIDKTIYISIQKINEELELTVDITEKFVSQEEFYKRLEKLMGEANSFNIDKDKLMRFMVTTKPSEL